MVNAELILTPYRRADSTVPEGRYSDGIDTWSADGEEELFHAVYEVLDGLVLGAHPDKHRRPSRRL